MTSVYSSKGSRSMTSKGSRSYSCADVSLTRQRIPIPFVRQESVVEQVEKKQRENLKTRLKLLHSTLPSKSLVTFKLPVIARDPPKGSSLPKIPARISRYQSVLTLTNDLPPDQGEGQSGMTRRHSVGSLYYNFREDKSRDANSGSDIKTGSSYAAEIRRSKWESKTAVAAPKAKSYRDDSYLEKEAKVMTFTTSPQPRKQTPGEGSGSNFSLESYDLRGKVNGMTKKRDDDDEVFSIPSSDGDLEVNNNHKPLPLALLNDSRKGHMEREIHAELNNSTWKDQLKTEIDATLGNSIWKSQTQMESRAELKNSDEGTHKIFQIDEESYCKTSKMVNQPKPDDISPREEEEEQEDSSNLPINQTLKEIRSEPRDLMGFESPEFLTNGISVITSSESSSSRVSSDLVSAPLATDVIFSADDFLAHVEPKNRLITEFSNTQISLPTDKASVTDITNDFSRQDALISFHTPGEEEPTLDVNSELKIVRGIIADTEVKVSVDGVEESHSGNAQPAALWKEFETCSTKEAAGRIVGSTDSGNDDCGRLVDLTENHVWTDKEEHLEDVRSFAESNAIGQEEKGRERPTVSSAVEGPSLVSIDASKKPSSSQIEVEIEKIRDFGLGFCVEGGKGHPDGDRPISVKRIFAGSTSAQKHLKVGDKILTAANQDVTGMSHVNAWKLLRSLPDGPIKMTIVRQNE